MISSNTDIAITHAPVHFVKDELLILTEEETVPDIIQTLLLDQQTEILLRSPVRFDFNAMIWKAGEPHAHIHLNHGNCRCAMSAPILPSYFIKFIMRHFYPQSWEANPDLELLSQDMIGYWLKSDEDQFLHFTANKPFSD